MVETQRNYKLSRNTQLHAYYMTNSIQEIQYEKYTLNTLYTVKVGSTNADFAVSIK